MKQGKQHYLSICYFLFYIFFLSIIPNNIAAQEDTVGITAYSDTTGTTSAILTPTEADDVSPQSNAHQFYWNFESDQSNPTGFFEGFFQQIFQWSIIFIILFFLIVIILPVLLLAGLIYLIYRLTHENSATQKTAGNPYSQTEIKVRLQQKAIRLGILGVGLLLIEYFFGFFHLSGILGIILICIALGQWFSNRT